MKKIGLLLPFLGFGFLFSQKKSEKLLPTQPNKDIFTQKDSVKSKLELKSETANSPFYKNLDSNKAARYKMLTKKVPSAKASPIQKLQPLKTDTLRKLKPIKPLSK